MWIKDNLLFLAYSHPLDLLSSFMYVAFMLILCVIYRYNCTFHVQEYQKKNVAEVEQLIYSALTSEYGNISFAIQTTNISIKHIGKLCF